MKNTPSLPLTSHTWQWQGRTDPAEKEGGLRWHEIIKQINPEDLPQSPGEAVSLLGFNCDSGVKRNHGRTGAAQGADALRCVLGSMPVHEAKILLDVGNIDCQSHDTNDGMEKAQKQLAHVIEKILEYKIFPIILGGGHEIAYGTFQGLANFFIAKQEKTPRIGIINLDAHFDLRLNENGTTSSGTPFRQISEHCQDLGWEFHYCCLGVSRYSNTPALFERAKALNVLWLEDDQMNITYIDQTLMLVKQFMERVDHLYFTIDLDVLPASVMPAVSAPAAKGVSLDVIEIIIDTVIHSKKLSVVDFAEFNPVFDVDQHGARTAARLIARLANGIAQTIPANKRCNTSQSASTTINDWDTLWRNVHLITLNEEDKEFGEISNGALAIKEGRIAWIGKEKDLPNKTISHIQDAKGAWMSPGFIDCHTHIVYAGNRSNEFEARLQGITYEEITRQGGGILSTVKMTRDVSFDQLLQQSLPRVQRLINEGLTTLEIKSGYGLSFEAEKKMLCVAQEIEKRLPVTVQKTFLGAHAVPLEFQGKKDDYIEHICNVMLPALYHENLIDAVDAFCEKIGFSALQTERIFQTAQKFHLPVKLHAEQLSDQNGAKLVSRFQGLSADHLEHLSPCGISAMAQNKTVAVLLPGAFYFLNETKLPPVQALRDANVPIAISTDCNPGTSPLTSLLLTMNMACILFKMTPQEALRGITCHAARALGLHRTIGSLKVGKIADLALWNIQRPADLVYPMGNNPCLGTVKNGVWKNPKYETLLSFPGNLRGNV